MSNITRVVIVVCLCWMVSIGAAYHPQVPFLKQPESVQTVTGKPEWIAPAWCIAEREARRLFPNKTGDIYKVDIPKVNFYDGLMEGIYLGIYDEDTEVVAVGLVHDDCQDFGTLVHEFIHHIAHKTKGLNTDQRNAMHAWVEVEWSADSN